jgi:hypothetical protein
MWVVSFTPWSLYPSKRAPCTHWIVASGPQLSVEWWLLNGSHHSRYCSNICVDAHLSVHPLIVPWNVDCFAVNSVGYVALSRSWPNVAESWWVCVVRRCSGKKGSPSDTRGGDMMNMAGLCFPGEGCYQVLAVTRDLSGKWLAVWCRDFTVKSSVTVGRIDEGYSFGYCPSPHSKIKPLILDIFSWPPQRFPLLGLRGLFLVCKAIPYAVDIKILWSCNSAHPSQKPLRVHVLRHRDNLR